MALLFNPITGNLDLVEFFDEDTILTVKKIDGEFEILTDTDGNILTQDG